MLVKRQKRNKTKWKKTIRERMWGQTLTEGTLDEGGGLRALLKR